jgi:hypothetical protein
MTSEERMTPTCTAVLNGPKPTYYPSYIDQSSQRLGPDFRLADKKKYVTFMDSHVEPRGWKRYPARPFSEVPVSPESEATTVSTSWRAVQTGAFRGKLRFHNVREIELGAILWALDFGEREGSCHTLGYAKPLGFGNVRLKVTGCALRCQLDGSAVDLAMARQAFTDYMEGAISGWESSEQMVQLLAMARPEDAKEHLLEYMTLKNEFGENEFVEAKKKGSFLPPYAHFEGQRDRARFPRVGRDKVWGERTGKAQKAEDQEKAAQEVERRKNLGPLGRLQETRSEVLKLAVKEQLEWLKHQRQVPPEETDDPRAFKTALATFVPEAVNLARQLGASRASSVRLDNLKKDLAEHIIKRPKDGGGKVIKKGRDFKNWKKQRDALEKQLENVALSCVREDEQRRKAVEFLSWLESDS